MSAALSDAQGAARAQRAGVAVCETASVDYAGRALAFVQASLPHARFAFLGGSAATGAATATSDLDILVIVESQQPVSYIETVEHNDQLIEAFVYDRASFDWWMQRDLAARRPVLLRLAAHGIVLTGSDEAHGIQARMRELLARGPEPLNAAENAARRYALSAGMDDLEAARSEAEEYAIAAVVFKDAAELTLLGAGKWVGTGKWLVRELEAARGEGRADELLAWVGGGARSAHELVDIARRVLDDVGGFIQAGMVRGEKPGRK